MDVNPVVTISYSGDYDLDFQSANEIAGLNQTSTPRGYVWHHLDDYDLKTNTGTMQLVEQNAHSGIPHSGGVSQYKAATGKSYTHPARFGEKKSCP
ncbi:HNH endonuclease [Pantoea ananatis]|uniref:HNH endonuclease signature motif containing protein n=1 Tax=uncultured Pantoea sp. TaxID=218084 RepID=UPI0021F7B5CC|nr:HNH endonuclease [Pantoea ananatis]